jgi:hypothetical protein
VKEISCGVNVIATTLRRGAEETVTPSREDKLIAASGGVCGFAGLTQTTLSVSIAKGKYSAVLIKNELMDVFTITGLKRAGKGLSS